MEYYMFFPNKAIKTEAITQQIVNELWIRSCINSIALAWFVGHSSEKRKGLADQVIAELWMIPIKAFGTDIKTIYRRTVEYISYCLGIDEKPEWVNYDWFDPNW